MAVTQQNHNQTFDGHGNLIRDDVVTVDVTAEAITFDLATKARAALTANATFLAAAKPATAAAQASAAYDQTVRLTREVNAVFRLLMGTIAQLGGEDLLTDNTGT